MSYIVWKGLFPFEGKLYSKSQLYFIIVEILSTGLCPVNTFGCMRNCTEKGEVDAVPAEHGGAPANRRSGILRSSGEDEAELGLVVVCANAGIHAGVAVVVSLDHFIGSGESCWREGGNVQLVSMSIFYSI